MNIRPATRADLAALAALEAACNPSPWSAAQLQAALALPNHIWLRATADDEPAAMLVWQQMADEAEIHLINTHPRHRRRGHARALLDALLQTARQRGIRRILLEVRAGNTAAQTLYRHHGFIECGRRNGYYGGSEDALLMEQAC